MLPDICKQPFVAYLLTYWQPEKYVDFMVIMHIMDALYASKYFLVHLYSTALDYSGFNRSSWPKRTIEFHRQVVEHVKNADTLSSCETVEREAGVRHSDLLRLPYFDIVRCHLVDSMHNLFLGTSKRMLMIWKDKKIISDSDFLILQEVDAINPPSNIGQIPSKIFAGSGFVGFTAEQWMHWTIV